MREKSETHAVLRAIIDDAYAVFDAPAPRDIEVCTECCMDPEAAREFLATEAAQLTQAQLREWFGAAKPKEVSQDLWTYLLPRIFDGLARGEEIANVGIQIVLRPFPTGAADRWRADEWSVIDRFQRAFLNHHGECGDECLDDVLCMFALGGWSVDALWAQVMAWPTEKIAARLYRDWFPNERHGKIWITAFWGDDDAKAAMMARYQSEDLAQRLMAFGMDRSAPKAARDKALDVANVITEKDY